MEAATAGLARNLRDALPAEVQRLPLDLHAQVLALQTQNATLRTPIHEIKACVGQDSSKSARPPSSGRLQAMCKRQASLTGPYAGQIIRPPRPLPAAAAQRAGA